MLSLMFSLCIAGEPCKEERVADFYTVIAADVCDLNKISMSADLVSLPEKARASFFECKEMPTNVAQVSAVDLHFEITSDGKFEKVELARFYGSVGRPLCQRNRDYYAEPIEQSAKVGNANVTLACTEGEYAGA